MKLRRFIFSALLFLSFNAIAQQDSSSHALNGWSAAAIFRYGRIIRHTPKIVLSLAKPAISGEVDFEKQTNGSQTWQQYYHYPVFGMGFLYTNYGNPILGSSYCLFPYMSIHILNRKLIDWRFTLSDGICIMTNPYNPITNPENNVIGTTLNDITRFSTSLQFKATPQLAFGIGGSFTHFSNGAVEFPNLGINTVTADLTARYTFSTVPLTHTEKDKLPPLIRRWQFQYKMGIGWMQHNPPDGFNERIYLATLSIGHYISHINRLSAGIEAGYSTDIYNYIRLEEILPITRLQAVRASVFISDEFVFGRIGLLIHYGYYFYFPVLQPAETNEKLGIHYYFLTYNKKANNRFFVGAYLSAYQISAEFVETSVGVEF